MLYLYLPNIAVTGYSVTNLTKNPPPPPTENNPLYSMHRVEIATKGGTACCNIIIHPFHRKKIDISTSPFSYLLKDLRSGNSEETNEVHKLRGLVPVLRHTGPQTPQDLHQRELLGGTRVLVQTVEQPVSLPAEGGGVRLEKEQLGEGGERARVNEREEHLD